MSGTNLGTAYVQIIPSAKGIGERIRREIGGETKGLGEKTGSTIAGSIKGAIAKAGIGAALTLGFKKALSEGGDLQQSYFGGLDTLYGNAADKAREYARAAVQAGVSQNSFAEQAVSFGAALKQAYQGDAAKAVEAANTAILDMTDNAAKMGTPLESIQDAYQGFAKQNYTMLDNLKLGYGGTKTEMERLLQDAQKLSGQEYDISNLGDVYEAIHVIQEDLGLTGVAAEEAADTFTGSLGAMRAAYDNLMGNLMIGENVGAAARDLVSTSVTFLAGNIIPAVGNIFRSVPEAAATFMQEGVPQIRQAGADLLSGLGEGISTRIPQILSAAMSQLTSISAGLKAKSGDFVDAGLQMARNIANGIISSIPVIIQTAPQIITNLAGIINSNAPKIIATGIEIVKNLAVGLIRAIPVLVANAPKIAEAIFAVIEAVNWLNLGRLAISGIAKGIKAALPSVKQAAVKIWDGVTAPSKAVASKVGSVVKSIKSHLLFAGLQSKVSGTFQRIKTAITSPIDKARTTVRNTLNKIKGFFPLSVGRIFSGMKLPHFSISGKAPFGIGGKGTKPSVSVSWYKKAMDNPYMFSSPTLIGAGEAGDEMLYGRNALLRDIREASSEKTGGTVNNFYITANGVSDPGDFAEELARELKVRMRMS